MKFVSILFVSLVLFFSIPAHAAGVEANINLTTTPTATGEATYDYKKAITEEIVAASRGVRDNTNKLLPVIVKEYKTQQAVKASLCGFIFILFFGILVGSIVIIVRAGAKTGDDQETSITLGIVFIVIALIVMFISGLIGISAAMNMVAPHYTLIQELLQAVR